MKHALFILLFVLTFSGQALAWDNICSVAGPIVNYTTAQVDEFGEKNSQRSFEGSGKIWDVKSGGGASKVTIIIDCGNHVWVEVPTSSPRTSNNLRIGEYINFSGKLNGVRHRRYANNRAWYLRVSFNDNSSVW